MLFDLKGKRKRLVQVVYLSLAILFGGSLVLFGTGSSVSGGLADAIFGGGGGGTKDVFADQVTQARQKIRVNPKNEQAWLELVRSEFNYAASPNGSDQQSGALTDKGQQAVIEVAKAWEQYLKLKPRKPDPATAQFAALAYGALRDYKKAVKTQALAARERPNANSYFQLAAFAYSGGQVKTGDRAAAEAIRRTPKDLRNSVKDQVKQVKKQGAQTVKAIKASEKASKKAAKGKPGGAAFGPLPGQGTGAGGSTPTPGP
jgi:tetratricopeptide (TPR) repeat protein